MSLPRYIAIPEIPDQIDLDDLDWSQSPPRLLEEKQYNELIALNKKHKIPDNKRISKNELNIKLNIKSSVAFVKYADRSKHCLVYYKGMKQDKHLGAGLYGKVKWLQDHESGKWHPVKIHLSDKGKPKEESRIMKKLGYFSEIYKNFSKSRDKNEYHQIMEFAKGKTLNDWSETIEFHQLGDERYLDLIISCLDTLSRIHNQKHGHGDISGSNIIYDISNNKATIIDFGRATTKDKNTIENDIKSLSFNLQMLLGILSFSNSKTETLLDNNKTAKTNYISMLNEIMENPDNNRLTRELDRCGWGYHKKNLVSQLHKYNQSQYESDDIKILHLGKIIMNNELFKTALFNVVNISVIKDDNLKNQVADILECMQSGETGLVEAQQALRDLRNKMPESVSVQRNIDIDKWHKMTEEEKRLNLDEFNYSDRISLIHTVTQPENDADNISVMKNCVEIHRFLSRAGFHFVSDQLACLTPRLVDEKSETPESWRPEFFKDRQDISQNIYIDTKGLKR